MTTKADLLRLAEPFLEDEYEWRAQSSGEKNGRIWCRVLCYVTNRAIMNRFDEVCGPDGWSNVFKEGPAGGVLCGISVRVTHDDGTTEWITKWDGADNTDVEPVKGGLSSSMKRAAVQWGAGRSLYMLEEGWANVNDHGKHSGKTKDGKWFKWDPPALPHWAVRTEGAREDQIARITEQLAKLGDTKISNAVQKRIVAGLTVSAAEEAITYLSGQLQSRAA